MKKYFLAMLGLSLLFFSNCNPKCESLVGVDITPKTCEEGTQIRITAQPLESLAGRQVFFGDKLGENIHFVANEGLIVTVPAGATGLSELKVEDPDCGDFTPVGIKIVGNGALFNQPGFVFPSSPEIFFPSTPTSYPPSIDNAWLTAYNGAYCIWLNANKEYVTDPVTGTIDTIHKTSLNAGGSFELSACNNFFGQNHETFFNFNSISGIVDKQSNYVFLRIDRSKQLGVSPERRFENFEGQFVNPKDPSVAKYNMPSKYIDCAGKEVAWFRDLNISPDNQMILVRSLYDGRQILIMHSTAKFP